MDEIDIPLFDEINDYEYKLGIMSLRKWIFFILMLIICIPMYLFGKKYVGNDAMSWLIIPPAAVFVFIGFIPVHDLSAEKIIPYWYRHYTLFAKPIKYISDEEYEQMKAAKSKFKKKSKKTDEAKGTDEPKSEAFTINSAKEEKELEKAIKKYGHKFIKTKEIIKDNDTSENEVIEKKSSEEKINDKFNSLTLEEKAVLFKLLDKK